MEKIVVVDLDEQEQEKGVVEFASIVLSSPSFEKNGTNQQTVEHPRKPGCRTSLQMTNPRALAEGFNG